MLKISKMTDYAMLILGELAKTPDAILSATAMSDALHLSVPTVSKILKMLNDADLLQSARGADGGYKLARAAKNISIVDVVMAMESGVALTACCEAKSNCVIDAHCAMQDNWRVLNQKMQQLLAQYSILDMLQPLDTQEVKTNV